MKLLTGLLLLSAARIKQMPPTVCMNSELSNAMFRLRFLIRR